jgi:hypothetical protein
MAGRRVGLVRARGCSPLFYPFLSCFSALFFFRFIVEKTRTVRELGSVRPRSPNQISESPTNQTARFPNFEESSNVTQTRV